MIPPFSVMISVQRNIKEWLLADIFIHIGVESMNNIRGILFDKDGTLLDNNLLWGAVGKAVGNMAAHLYNLDSAETHSVMTAIGFDKSEKTLIANSPIASGTALDIACAIQSELLKYGIRDIELCKLLEHISGTIEHTVQENVNLIRPCGDIKLLFDFLKSKKILIGLATADLYATTIVCLRQLEIEDYFSYIGTDDGKSKPKPHPDHLLRFCKKCGISCDEAAVVGDSISDIEMGKNGGAGLTVAISPETGSDKNHACGANFTVTSVDKLIDLFYI